MSAKPQTIDDYLAPLSGSNYETLNSNCSISFFWQNGSGVRLERG
jgi:hypothetical protein